MNNKKIKWQNDHICSWCFEPMDRFTMFFCSNHCKEEAERWTMRQDAIAKYHNKTVEDLQKHNAEIYGEDSFNG